MAVDMWGLDRPRPGVVGVWAPSDDGVTVESQGLQVPVAVLGAVVRIGMVGVVGVPWYRPRDCDVVQRFCSVDECVIAGHGVDFAI